MGPNSQFRRSLLQTLTKNLSYPAVNSFFSISKSTFARAKNENLTRSMLDFTEPLTLHGQLGVEKPRKTEAQENAVAFWFQCATRTHRVNDEGDRMDVYHCAFTKTEVFNKYVIEAALRANLTVVESELEDSTFLKFPEALDSETYVGKSLFFELKPSNVILSEIVESSCPICRDGYAAEEALNRLREEHRVTCAGCDCDGPVCECGAMGCKCCRPAPCVDWLQFLHLKSLNSQVERWRGTIADRKAHQVTVRAQRTTFKNRRGSLGTRGHPDFIIAMDFSGYRKAYDRYSSLGDAFFANQALHLTLHSRADDGSLKRENFDYFSPEENDYYFVRRSLLDLFHGLGDRLKGKSVEFWTDGGPKHFKTRRSVFFVVAELHSLFPCTIRWNFFASHHGKSVCDAHAAHVKHVLKRLARAGTRSEGADHFAAAARKVKKTSAKSFQFLNKTTTFDVSAMAGIKSFHSFELSSQPSASVSIILCRTLSTDAEGVFMRVESTYSVDEHSDASVLDRAEPVKGEGTKAKGSFTVVGTVVEVGYVVAAAEDGSSKTEWSVGTVTKHEKTTTRAGKVLDMVRVFFSAAQNPHLDEDEVALVDPAAGDIRIL